MISQSTIEKVYQLDLVEVIGRYTELKQKGAQYWGLSPFTDENTPSFTVNLKKQIWKCFSTGHGGNNAVSFIQQKDALPWPDAIKMLAENFGIHIEYENYDNDQLKQEATEKEDLLKINEATTRQYLKQLVDVHQDHAANKILFERWPSDDYHDILDLVIKWQIGYAPDDWQFLTSIINEKALNQQAEQLGLINKKNKRYYDFFRNRLMFPIQDHKGRVVAFGGRKLSTDPREPKYFNSPESPVYDKSHVLYGLFHAIPSITKAGFAYLTEGYTDVISYHQAGFTNTVCSCGTGLTAGQVKLLKKYTRKVIIVYDGDEAGIKATINAIHLFIENGFECHVVILPADHDPDSFVRSHPQPLDYMQTHQQDAIMFKAEHLLSDVENPLKRNEHFNDVARTLATIGAAVARSDYGRKIARKYKLDWSTFKQIIDDHINIIEKKRAKNKNKDIKKNVVADLNGKRNTYKFFEEEIDKNGNFQGIRINKLRLIQLLSSFGYSRYEVSNDNYTFVQIQENVIKTVQRDEIIDHIERYVFEEYDFEAAGCDYVDSEILINKFYDGMRTYFSKDLFGRVRLEKPIIINEDNAHNTFIYYKNGFVTIDKDGWKIQSYEQMNGSVWQDQIIDREFTPVEFQSLDLQETEINGEKKILLNAGIFADFVFRISGAHKALDYEDKAQQNKYWLRFHSLCSLIGYLIHDFYEYKLKAVLLTDSSLSDESDGRTGKTLLGELIGCVRSYCEINGKDFDVNNANKYQDAKIGTQVLHLNDVRHRGRNRFDFESIFNDITEGYMVNAKYMTPFRNFSKMIISTNKTLNISGGSQRDRIIEFEMSDFFNEHHSPVDFYGHWLMREWDQSEWNRFDNFMCYCAQQFHQYGIINPTNINLEMRKLKDHTCQEFIDFMNDIRANVKEKGEPFENYHHLPPAYVENDFFRFEFDKKKLYNKFKDQYEDYQANWFKQAVFTKWLKMYAQLILDIQNPIQKRSNGQDLIIFKNETL